MTVKQFWKQDLGEFREEDRKVLNSLRDKYVAVDTSAWVHQLDGVDEIKYARTSVPPYPHPAIINLFAARHSALEALGIHPIFILDGKSPTNKNETNTERQKKSKLACKAYNEKIKKNQRRKDRNNY